MSAARNIVGVVLLFAIVITFQSAAFIVSEPEQVIITQFGKPIDRKIDTPGLKFKLPVIQKANRFDKRFLEWDGDPNQLPTRDKRFIWVDSYARWRISDPLLYFQRLQNERGARTRLDDILDGETRNAIANHDLIEVIRSTNRQAEFVVGGDAEEIVRLEDISIGREKIRQEILEKSAGRTSDLGIEILDFQFKRINYNQDVRQTVYERMITERKRIADRYRSEGEGEAARIQGDKSRDLYQIQSDAYRQAQEIIGNADATATAIYAAAYDVSASSREFYRFLKTMETYQTTVDPETWLLMSTDGEFYRYLKESDGSK